MTAVISEFTRTILNPFDLQQLLHQLTGHAAELTRSQGAGIMLAGRREGKLGFAAASDERVVEMELVQDRVEAGACHQAFLDNQLIIIEDLETSDRWHAYEQRAAQLGLRSVLAVPMNAWGETIGVVNIYRDAPGPWSPEDVEAAQILTAMGSGYVLHANQIRAQHDLADQLQAALEGRDLIGQAKGILMNRDGLDADTAFDQLRTISQTRNVKLRDVAHRVVTAGAADEYRTVANGSAPAGTTPRTRTATHMVGPLGTNPRQRDEVAALRDAESDRREQTEEPSSGPEPDPRDSELRDQTADRHDEDAADRDDEAHARDRPPTTATGPLSNGTGKPAPRNGNRTS